METSLDCLVIVSEQDNNLKTYAEIDGTLLVNQEGEFFGKTIDGSLTVVRDIVDACLGDVTPASGHPAGGIEQNIRLAITIDGEDVIDSLIGDITIQHNKNYISTFSLQLGNPKYSPLVDAHIAVDSEVVITAYINGQEIKLFTGLIDTTNTDYDGGYKLMIKGRDYGKKLLEKTMTLISVEQSANKKYRGSVVEYIAGKGDITNIDVPIGDAIGIDHSFQDQSLWDMIQKECAIEGWFVRFDENAKMILKTTSKKTIADWEYGEDKFEELGLETTDRGIINKVTILGTIFEEEVITVNELEVEPYEPTYDVQTHTYSKSFSLGEVVDGWSDEDANFRIKAKYIGWTKQPGLPFNPHQDYQFTITPLNNDLKHVSTEWIIGGNAFTYWERRNSCRIHRKTYMVGAMSFQEGAFTFSVAIKTSEQTDGGKEQYEAENPTEEYISTMVYTQIKASVQDANSIALYGERKPNNEGTLQFPLAETEAQCKRIGENVIIESHRFIKQPDYSIAFNPKLIVGYTVKLTDTKIGYNEEWVVEEVVHMINIGKEGEIKARMRIGCVYYA